MILRFFGDLKIREVAGVLDMSVGTVKVHLARGLQGLRKVLKAEPFWEKS